MRISNATAIQKVAWGRLWWVGLLAIAASVVANLIARAIMIPLFDLPTDFKSLEVGSITFLTIIGVVGAVIVFAVVGRFTARPARTYTIIAVIAFILSLIPDLAMAIDPAVFSIPGATPAGALSLMIFHLFPAVISVWLLTTQGLEQK